MSTKPREQPDMSVSPTEMMHFGTSLSEISRLWSVKSINHNKPMTTMSNVQEKNLLWSPCTEHFFHSVATFCPGFQYNLRGPAWEVGSCSISPPADGTFQDVIFQTLRLSGKNALYSNDWVVRIFLQKIVIRRIVYLIWIRRRLCFDNFKHWIRLCIQGDTSPCSQVKPKTKVAF